MDNSSQYEGISDFKEISTPPPPPISFVEFSMGKEFIGDIKFHTSIS